MTVQHSIAALTFQPCDGPAIDAFRPSTRGPTIIGRAEDCGFILADPHVSRYHASLIMREGAWLLTDLGSRHGTFVNDVRLEPDVPTVVEPGDYVRIEPFVFHLQSGDASRPPSRATDAPVLTTSVVTEPTEQELKALPEKRLELLMEGAASIQRAAGEPELAEAILDLTISGTGFARGVILRWISAAGEGEVVAWRDEGPTARHGASYSRYLVAQAAAGHVVRLSKGAEDPLSLSIGELGIHSAVCCPITLDDAVTGMIYLDSRVTEQPCYPDAAGYCHAVARLAGLSLSAIRRAELQRRQQRLEEDLNIARRVQQMLGPAETGCFGDVAYASSLQPGRYVAGDLLDLFEDGVGRLVISCGDVAGQGFGAGILMSAVMSHIRAGVDGADDPAPAVSGLNRYLAERSPSNSFVTLFVGLYDPSRGTLRYVDAGHGHWLLRRCGQEPVQGEMPGGPPVGIDADITYESRSLALEPGDRIVLFSDGMIEHRGAEGEQFGRQRLMEAIRGANSAREDVESALAALNAFVGKAGRDDDTTIASVQIGGGTA